MLERNPSLTHAEVRNLLRSTGTLAVTEPGKPVGTFLNAEAAVAAAKPVSWGPFVNLGGTCIHGPAIASRGSNRLDVFVVGTKGAVSEDLERHFVERFRRSGGRAGLCTGCCLTRAESPRRRRDWHRQPAVSPGLERHGMDAVREPRRRLPACACHRRGRSKPAGRLRDRHRQRAVPEDVEWRSVGRVHRSRRRLPVGAGGRVTCGESPAARAGRCPPSRCPTRRTCRPYPWPATCDPLRTA